MISKWLLCRINLLLFPFVSETYLHICSSYSKPFWAKALIFLRSAAAAAKLHINNHLQNSSLVCSVSSINNFEVERWKHGGQRVSGVYVKSEVSTDFSETWSGSSSYTLSLTQTHHPGGVDKRGQVQIWQNFLAGFTGCVLVFYLCCTRYNAECVTAKTSQKVHVKDGAGTAIMRWTHPPRGGGGKICSQVVTHVTPWQWQIKVVQQLQTPTSLIPLT